MSKKLLVRLKSEVGQPRQWRYAVSITHAPGPAGLTWLAIRLDNGDTIYCHPSQIDCLIEPDTHPAS